jgi:glucose-6-phosphate dehydrogenase assembly protein OpcA
VPSQFVSLTSGELRIANVANLEGEFSRLWQSAAGDPETKQAVTRASVLTLLAYAEDEADGAEALRQIGEITYENPCRAIVMIADRAAPVAGLRASISAHCRVPGPGEKQVCCETISIHASGKTVEGLKSVVVPLVIPELPVYLWWRAECFSPPEYMAEILRVSDRVLVNSSTFPDPMRGLGDLSRQIRRRWGGRQLAFSDLTWARVTPWRELLAHCFDFPEARDCLRRIARVRIQWAADGEASAGLLLAAWLAGRLGWQPQAVAASEAAGWVFNLGAGGQPVRVVCERVAAAEKDASPLLVIIEIGGEVGGTFQFTESLAAEKITGYCAVAGRPPFERTVFRAPANLSRLITDELRFPSHDAIYEEVLDTLSRLMALAN